MKPNHISKILAIILTLICLKTKGQEFDTLAFDKLFKTSLSYFSQPLILAQYTDSMYWSAKGSNDQKRKALALKMKGVSTYQRSLFDSSLFYYNKGLNINLQLRDSLEIGKGYINLATSYNAIFEFETAVANALKAESIFEAINDPVGVARVYNIIAQMYFHRNDHESALKYFKKHYKTALDRSDTMEIVVALNNIGSSYIEIERFDSSLFYLSKVVEISKKVQVPGIGATHQNLGLVYAGLDEYSKSNKFYHKAEKYYLENDDFYRQSEIYFNLGSNYVSLNQLDLAEKYLEEALEIAQQVQNKIVHKKALINLSKINVQKKKFSQAHELLQASISISDEILNEENQKNIAELQAKYDTQKKEQIIAMQDLTMINQQNTIQNRTLTIVSLIALVIIIFVLAYLFFYRQRKNQMLVLQKKDLEYKELQLGAIIDSQEKERKRFATDLHDGFGQLISILKLNVESIEQQKDDEKRHSLFEKSTAILNDMYGELRNICFNLMPQSLVKFGLVPSLKEFADKINDSGKLVVEVLAFEMDDRLPNLQEISLYRITQEWVNNILKYGDAENITIQITKDNFEITLTIEDNGTGYELEKLTQSKGNGWKNMRSRANLIHADIEVDTTPHIKGNMLAVNLPVNSTHEIMESEQAVSD